MDREESVQVIGLLSAYFPHMTLPEPTVVLWADEIAEYDYGAALVAVKQLGRTFTHPPSLADVREAVKAEHAAEMRRKVVSTHALGPAVETRRSKGMPSSVRARLEKLGFDRIGKEMPV